MALAERGDDMHLPGGRRHPAEPVQCADEVVGVHKHDHLDRLAPLDVVKLGQQALESVDDGQAIDGLRVGLAVPQILADRLDAVRVVLLELQPLREVGL